MSEEATGRRSFCNAWNSLAVYVIPLPRNFPCDTCIPCDATGYKEYSRVETLKTMCAEA